MTVNPYARPFACSRCKDVRWVSNWASMRRGDLAPCPDCGGKDEYDYRVWKREQWLKANPTTLCEIDLSDAEFSVYKTIRGQHPELDKREILSYIEGQRYEPAKDEEFLKDARLKFKKWRER